VVAERNSLEKIRLAPGQTIPPLYVELQISCKILVILKINLYNYFKMLKICSPNGELDFQKFMCDWVIYFIKISGLGFRV